MIGRDAVERDGPRRGSFVAVTGGTETAAVIMRGELTAASRRQFDREVTRLLEAAPSAVTVDMSDVTYLDVVWIEVLRHLRTRASGEGEATVQVSAASAAAREVLERSGLASEVVMPTSDGSAPVRARRATTPAGAGAGLAASASREPPPVSPQPEDTGPARQAWFKGGTELQKLFLAGAAGTVLLVLVALVPSHRARAHRHERAGPLPARMHRQISGTG